MGILDAPGFNQKTMTYQRAASLPSGLGWDSTHFPVTPSIQETMNGQVVGSAGITPEALFDRVSTARSAPSATYYVDKVAGNDANNGTSWATPFSTPKAAHNAGEAGGVPFTVFVEFNSAGYDRSGGWSNATHVDARIDAAWIGTDGHVPNGRPVQIGVWDVVASFTADATYTNTYTRAVSNCERVLDKTTLDAFGNWTELLPVSSAAICNRTPGSWYCNGTTLYVQRLDGAVPSDTNMRYFRTSPNFQVQQQVNVYMEGIDLQGSSSAYNVFQVNSSATTAPATPNAIVTKNCLFRWGGNTGAVAGKGIGPTNWFGLIANFGTRCDANANDGFGGHNNTAGGVGLLQLNVNCIARNNGRGNQSVNGFTGHEHGVSIDIAGIYDTNRGGNVHFIDNSLTYLLGTMSRNDLGDAAAGGAIPAVAYRAAGSATVWAERCRLEMPPGTFGYQSAGTGSVIHRRDCTPSRVPDSGAGTFDTF